MKGLRRRPRAGPLVAVLLCIGAGTAALAQTVTQSSRGELLYATHCIGCHTTEIHWRERKLATDWATLRQQVRRWAGNTGLGWGDDEILDVARYLNAKYYRFEIATLTEREPAQLPHRAARAD
jgi:mono/diheme cytochrome c family protein